MLEDTYPKPKTLNPKPFSVVRQPSMSHRDWSVDWNKFYDYEKGEWRRDRKRGGRPKQPATAAPVPVLWIAAK